MVNKMGCSCGCGGNGRFRLVLLGLAIIVLLALGISQAFKNDSPEKAGVASNATVPAGQENVDLNAPHVPFTLVPEKVIQAGLIPVKILSTNLAEAEGEVFRSVALAPEADWQGDFTAERIAATLLSAYKTNSSGSDVVEIYLLPVPLKSEAMLDEVALGKLIVEAKPSSDSELVVMPRGYLPQELEFLTLWDEMWPDFVEDAGVNRKALTNAIIEKIGAGAYGMDYPFQDPERVENLPALLESWQK